jgi:ribonucleoside-diphosphate reductase alpha chain
LQEIIRQLSGIGGGRPLGFGPNRVRSLPDGVAHVLSDYLASRLAGELDPDPSRPAAARPAEEPAAIQADQPLLTIGDLCPECGQAAMVNEEGCHKCYACGYSEC